MEKYNLTPELEARVNAMSYEERAVFWNEGEYRAYMETLPVPVLLTMANSTDAIRTDARVVLLKKMEDAGLLEGET